MELPSVPHQPKSFDFPKRSFGKKVIVKRSFQASWFDRWSWLHYIESNDVALCLNCAQAKQQKKLTFFLAMLMTYLYQKASQTGRMLL